MSTIIKKIILAIVAMFCMVVGARAQCNASGTIVILTTQAEVDAFATSYAGCPSLTIDNLWIWAASSTAITDISAINIPIINGNVSISGNFSSDVNITTINGDFTINNHNVNGAPALHFVQPATITGEATIADDGVVPTLSDINIQHIGGSCHISGVMQNLYTFSALQSVGGELQISANLQSSVGMNSLQSVGGLEISNCTSLLHLVGFDHLAAVTTSYIGIHNNPDLLTISAFGTNNTPTVLLYAHRTQITNNPMLQSIQNCNNIVDGDIIIMNNPSLVNIDGFKNNQIAQMQDISITNNDALVTINHLLENITTVNNVSVIAITDNDNLQSVNAFSTLTSAGNILLAYNPMLTILPGFTQLNTVTHLQINTCNALLNLNSFAGLINITNLLYLRENAVINDLTSLQSGLIINDLQLENNPNLAYCHVPAVCNHLALGRAATIIGNATGCTSVPIVQAQCMPLPCTLTATISGNTNVCNGQTTTICAYPINGIAPFTYSWSDGTNSTCTNVNAGMHTIQITDAIGCTAIATVNVSNLIPTTQNWYFGYGAGLTFASGNPVAIPTPNSVNTWEGTAVAEDASGNLLFYTDGNNIWDACHSLVTTLGLTTASTAQAATILPVVGSATDFYIFSVEDANATNKYAYYTRINTTGTSGAVTVVGAPKTILSAFDCGESLTIMPHQNGIDSWVITGERNTAQMFAYLVSNAGVSTTPVVSNTTVLNGFGYSKVHCVAALLARARTIGGGTSGTNGWAVYDMNKTTGVITLKHDFTASTYVYPYGVEFAPSGKLLYGSDAKGGGLYQFNLGTLVQTKHWNSFVMAGAYSNSGALQIASDGKIYMAADQHASIHVINNPDMGGVACNFLPNSLPLTFNSGLGLPTQPVAHCTPVATENKDKNDAIFALQPNPTTGIVNISLNRLSETDMNVTVSNLQGIVLENQKLYKGTAATEFDLSKYPSGLYFITMLTADGERVTQKVVKE